MRMIGTIGVALAAVVLPASASGWDYLWGTWEQRNDPTVTVILTPSNITISASGTQEVWVVTNGTGIVTGMQVSRNGKTVEAKGSVKFNHMIFHIGDRTMVLRKTGTEDIKFAPGEEPNKPEQINKPVREQQGGGYSPPAARSAQPTP